MNISQIVWKKFPFRIVEVCDYDCDLESLKGDLFKWEHAESMGFTGTREEMEAQEKRFEYECETEGVYGYQLQICNLLKKDSEGEYKYTYIYSCYGFVGQYNSKPKHKYNHYIVKEMKGLAAKMRAGKIAV